MSFDLYTAIEVLVAKVEEQKAARKIFAIFKTKDIEQKSYNELA